ncbi:MAG TPA: sigma-54 dependent transcriptional regulator [bacterium]|nr:sigma-54 dependent transcriptional regulator [bacterium]
MVKSNRPIILAVDDEEGVQESYRLILEEEYQVLTAGDAEEALQIVQKHHVNVVLLDIMLPGKDGISALQEIKKADERIDVIMATAVKTVQTAVAAIKHGAYDYLVKPFDVEDILTVVRRALERQALVKEVMYLRSEVERQSQFENMVAKDEKMIRIFKLISRVADNDATVLIAGESGTGKELIARAIHQKGPRCHSPFVAFNCAAVPDNLLESELFGHERGAFTGALEKRVGKFELADGGTLFLDEIGSMRIDLQAKILRALQEREIERVGGSKTIKVDVRIVAASNADLRDKVMKGQFREDLFYRLNVIPIWIPPLRDRREDIPLLIEHFLNKYNRKFNRQLKGLTPSAHTVLVNYNWPGNVRELENIIERLVAIGETPYIHLDDLPLDSMEITRGVLDDLEKRQLSLAGARTEFETHYILWTLERTHWNQSEAARILGIHRNTLVTKIRELGLRNRNLPPETAGGPEALRE